MEKLSKLLKSYLSPNNNDFQPIYVDRAFLALYAMFKILKKESGRKKIIFPSTTCLSPVFACLYAGLIPEFVEIDLVDYRMPFEGVMKKIKGDSDIAAIVYIYLFGHSSMDALKLKEALSSTEILLIEDVAQAFGAEVNGVKAGLIGDLSVFSFGHTKQIDIGFGGFFINNSNKLDTNNIMEVVQNCERFQLEKGLAQSYTEQFYQDRLNCFTKRKDFTIYRSYVDNYEELYFKKGNVNWKEAYEKLKLFIELGARKERNKKAKKYSIGLSGVDKENHLVLPNVEDQYSVYRYSFIMKNFNQSSELCDFLRSRKIHCSNLYLPVCRIFHSTGFEETLSFSSGVVNLWVNDEADDDYIDKTIDAISEYLNKEKYGTKKN